jgi:hypothetical protein
MSQWPSSFDGSTDAGVSLIWAAGTACWLGICKSAAWPVWS